MAGKTIVFPAILHFLTPSLNRLFSTQNIQKKCLLGVLTHVHRLITRGNDKQKICVHPLNLRCLCSLFHAKPTSNFPEGKSIFLPAKKQKAKDFRSSSADVLRKQVSSKQKDNEISFIFWAQIAENCPTIRLILHWHKTLDALP